jgi:DNA-binding NarL/FixJ family response regulator
MELEELEVDYLRSIDSIIPAHATAFYLFSPVKSKPLRIAASGVDQEFLSYYEEKGRELDPLRAWIYKNRSPNQSQRLLGLEGWKLHPVYHVVGTADIDFAMQCPVLAGENIIGTLNFGRTVDEGQFTVLDLKAVQILSHFLSLALAQSLGFNSISIQQAQLCYAIEKVQQGIIIADSDLNVRYANKKALSITDWADNRKDYSVHQLSEMIRDKAVPTRSCFLPGTKEDHSLIFLDEIAPPPAKELFNNMFTSREMDVLRLVEKGMNNKQIAYELGISVNTVKRHLDKLYCKMNVYSRTELVARVYRLLNSMNR